MISSPIFELEFLFSIDPMDKKYSKNKHLQIIENKWKLPATPPDAKILN
jgi:hypothetical protein